MTFLAAVAASCAATTALAIDFTQKVVNADGNVLCYKTDAGGACEIPYTLALAIRVAADHPNNNPPNLDAAEKIRRGELAQGLAGATDLRVGSPGFTESDRRLMRDMAARAFPPSIGAVIARMLDAKDIQP